MLLALEVRMPQGILDKKIQPNRARQGMDLISFDTGRPESKPAIPNAASTFGKPCTHEDMPTRARQGLVA